MESSDVDTSSRQRKFGLPDWMINNIERLNFVTDFEQYACSPPETEGFLAEYKEGQEMQQSVGHFCPIVEPQATPDKSIQNVVPVSVMSESQPPKFLNVTSDSPSLHQAFLDSLKNEEIFSSPDSTPCVTPEPSPLVRRKMSNPTDTVITNPGRWFYLGKVNKLPKKLKDHTSDIKNKENKVKREDRCSVASVKANEAILESKKDGIKLMISDFDLNAISPTSW